MYRRLGTCVVVRLCTAVLFVMALALGSSFGTGDALAMSGGLPAGSVTQQSGTTWVEYQVGGDATEEHSEPDVVMCSEIGDGEFSLHSMGEWVITIETPSPALGEHEASFLLAPPQGKYRDDNFRTEDRAKGTGTITLEDGGKDAMGMTILKGTFSAADLSSEGGFSFTLEGSYSCVKF